MAGSSRQPDTVSSGSHRGRFRLAGLGGAMAVLVVVLAFVIVPPVVAQLPPSQGQIRPGSVLDIGQFTYVPNPNWTEELARSRRGAISVISKDGEVLQVNTVAASTPRQAYIESAKQLRDSRAASIGSGTPLSAPSGLQGLRSAFFSPTGDGTLAVFAAGRNRGIAFLAINQVDYGTGAPQEVDAMINSVKAGTE